MKTNKPKGGALDGFKYWWEPVPGDRGKRWKIKKLKRPSVHYVLGKPVRVRVQFNRGLLAVVSKLRTHIDRGRND